LALTPPSLLHHFLPYYNFLTTKCWYLYSKHPALMAFLFMSRRHQHDLFTFCPRSHDLFRALSLNRSFLFSSHRHDSLQTLSSDRLVLKRLASNFVLGLLGSLLGSRNRLAPSFVFGPLGSLLESRNQLAPRFVFGPPGSLIWSRKGLAPPYLLRTACFSSDFTQKARSELCLWNALFFFRVA
jgi:hypothetical protein